ncbi:MULTISPECIES: hypothetical protein [Yersinia]|uniref:hypothetical protein n=1 Tax=Yersinia TaxID=629 RepID=UPI0009B71634|nr:MULTISPECIES: hypothetical protein [Yersinia]ARB84892.1 hypothetical protein A6J67_13325 [Yersinia sp. FDAARGOS_228]AVL34683.1 hypothetical protein CEQ36_02940 [Yersinia intermedia]
MKCKFLIICSVMAVAVLTGCTSQKVTSHEDQNFLVADKAARYCTNLVGSDAKSHNGKTTLTSIFWHKGQYVRAGDSLSSQEEFRAIPMMEASVVDQGKPGSYWRNCMSKQGIVIGF